MSDNVIEEFLKDQNWQFNQAEGKSFFFFGISGKNGNFQCMVDSIADDKQFLFFSICATNTPNDKKLEMLKLLNALNNKLFLGNFEMDIEDGEIRYRTNLSYKHFELNKLMIEDIVMTNIVTMDRCLPSIMALMYSDVSVEEALMLSSSNEEI